MGLGISLGWVFERRRGKGVFVVLRCGGIFRVNCVGMDVCMLFEGILF